MSISHVSKTVSNEGTRFSATSSYERELHSMEHQDESLAARKQNMESRLRQTHSPKSSTLEVVAFGARVTNRDAIDTVNKK